jgi:hypothetical protein
MQELVLQIVRPIAPVRYVGKMAVAGSVVAAQMEPVVWMVAASASQIAALGNAAVMVAVVLVEPA